MSGKYDVIEYTTANGKNKISEFLDELYKKRLSNEILIATRLLDDLRDYGLKQSPPNIVKMLDRDRGIYEIKRKGKDVRLGLYVTKNEETGAIVVLAGFLKDSQKTRKVDLDTLRHRQSDYETRKTKNGK